MGDKLMKHHKGSRSIVSGSSSVFINGKPAARVGDAINCGGVIIQGSPNVFIGDKANLLKPSKVTIPDLEQNKLSGSGGGQPPKGSTPPTMDAELIKIDEPTPEEIVEPEPELAPATVRLAISPTNPLYQDTQFIMTSTDGSISMTKTVADDKIPGDNYLDLQFDDLDTSKTYTLEQVDNTGAKITYFEGFGHSSIGVQSPAKTKLSEDEEDT